MKRISCLALVLCLCLGLFAGCAETPVEPAPTPPAEETPTPTPEPMPEPIGKGFSFTRENMPRMDGSTSLVPLSQAAASLLLGESRESVEDLVRFNRTSQSYRNLMYGQCDILIASVPSADVYEELDNNNFLYEMEPIATDALIFVVNEGNPVDNLSTEQIIGIYTGEITNWSEVGGADEPIAAFQRNSGAGSQALMEKLVMGDIPMMTPPTDLMAGSMGELMEYVRSYDNSAGAIGYSVYYYANDMRMAEGLKIIAVDGVEPTDENIRIGAYPHLSNYYTVIGADEPAESPARIMFEWLQSAEGQRLVQSEGYVPVKSEADFDGLLTVGGWAVETHPEVLTAVDTPEAKYSRLSEERIETLAARDDYGALYPFVGLVNYSEWDGAKPVYGLFDSQSRIVCDPGYSEVSRLCYWGNGQNQYVPLLLLGRSVEGEMRYSIATLDGAFVSPEYNSVRGCNYGAICSNGYSDPDFVIYDFGGNIIFRGGDMKLNGLRFESVYDMDGLYMLAWLNDGEGSDAYVIDIEGNITAGPWASAEFARDGRIIATKSFDYASTGLADCFGNWIIEPKYQHLTEHRMHYITSDTRELYTGGGILQHVFGKDYSMSGLGIIDGESFRFLHNGSTIPLEGEWQGFYSKVDCPVIYKQSENSIELMNVLSGKTLTLETFPDGDYPQLSQLMMDYVAGPFSALEYIVFWDGEPWGSAELISWDLETRFTVENSSPGMSNFSTVMDEFSLQEYICVRYVDKEPALYSAELELIASPGEWTNVWNGCLVNTDEAFCTYTDASGEVIFRYPLMINGD